jgi:hypothetical protein
MSARGPIAQIVKVEPAVATVAEAPAVAPTTPAMVPTSPAMASASPEKPATAAPETPKTVRAEKPVASAPRPVTRREPLPPPPTPTAVKIPDEVIAPAAPLDLPPFPNVSDTTSVPEILLIVKKRLELLYQKTGGNSPN